MLYQAVVDAEQNNKATVFGYRVSDPERYGVAEFDELLEKVEELPTLYSVDLLNMDTCRNDLLMEDIKQYGREI